MEFFLQTIGILKSTKMDFISELPSVVKILQKIYKFKKILRQTARLHKRQIRKWRNRFWDEIHCHGLNHKDKELKKDSKYNVAGIRLETVVVFGNRVTVRISPLRNKCK